MAWRVRSRGFLPTNCWTVSYQLQTSRFTQIIHVDSHLFENALIYNQRSDTWSLTDCSSFLIMSHYSITDAIAHDKHFIQAGFRALLRD